MGKVKQDPEEMEVDGVITAAGLTRKGRHLAYKRPDGKIQITPAGHAEIGMALKAQAQRNKLLGKDVWVRPPSSGEERERS